MSNSSILIIALALIITTMIPVHAQNSCGAPADNSGIGEALETCNIYKRQFAYREKRIELRQAINDRREDFIAPSIEIYKQHKADMAALNAKRNAENDVTSR